MKQWIMTRIPKEKDTLHIPELSLVLLIGASGSGKSTFARRIFKPTEIISSDVCRGLIADDENNQSVTKEAFELARFIAAKRLKRGMLTVIDATNVQPDARKDWIALAREYHVLPVAIVLNTPESICQARNKTRTDRALGQHVIPQQIGLLRRSLRHLRKEGFRQVVELSSVEEMDRISFIHREKLYSDFKHDHGPFDIIGDVHGCYTELCLLLEKLGYRVDREQARLLDAPLVTNGDGYTVKRKPVLLGDLVDRGPDSPQVLRLAMDIVKNGHGYCVPGNHDVKLKRYLEGKDVKLRHGLEKTVEQLKDADPAFLTDVSLFIDGLVSHYVLDDGKLVVAHAGLREEMHGRGSGQVREFCLFGETTGEIDEFGLPVRYNWALEYSGRAMVVYGHTPVPAAQWLNNTIDIDTGCVFGGALTALRYPERELVEVPALEQYALPARPVGYNAGSPLSLQQQFDDMLDIKDLLGKQILQPRYGHSVTIREENAVVALEAMSRFGVNPKWMIYLPPTMSPAETSTLGDYLEHPAEGFAWYRNAGIRQVVCEEKHMGSRAVVIICRDEEVVQRRFGISGEGNGIVYTRTGRPFFNDKKLEQEFIGRINAALIQTGFYDKFETDWVCLDAELMPWSAKAQALLSNQYASTGAAATTALSAVVEALQQAAGNGAPAAELLKDYATRQVQAEKFVQAYREYCWPVKDVNDYKLAPFHILATEGKTWFDQSHEWHMQAIRDICAGDTQLLLPTPYRVVDLADPAQEAAAIQWWETLTAGGGEGMVIKPYQFLEVGNNGIIQPAIKIRGSEYLRIIYGPEYDSPDNLARLRKRGLGHKRALALREFSLGLEALHLFVEGAPLQQVHRQVFGLLALESEPVDPRL